MPSCAVAAAATKPRMQDMEDGTREGGKEGGREMAVLKKSGHAAFHTNVSPSVHILETARMARAVSKSSN